MPQNANQVKKLSPFSNTTGQTYFAGIPDISFGPSMPDISSKLMYLTHIPTIQVWLNLRAIESVKTTWKWQESVWVLCKMKHYLRHENKANENKVLIYCEVLRYM